MAEPQARVEQVHGEARGGFAGAERSGRHRVGRARHGCDHIRFAGLILANCYAGSTVLKGGAVTDGVQH